MIYRTVKSNCAKPTKQSSIHHPRRAVKMDVSLYNQARGVIRKECIAFSGAQNEWDKSIAREIDNSRWNAHNQILELDRNETSSPSPSHFWIPVDSWVKIKENAERTILLQPADGIRQNSEERTSNTSPWLGSLCFRCPLSKHWEIVQPKCYRSVKHIPQRRPWDQEQTRLHILWAQEQSIHLTFPRVRHGNTSPFRKSAFQEWWTHGRSSERRRERGSQQVTARNAGIQCDGQRKSYLSVDAEAKACAVKRPEWTKKSQELMCGKDVYSIRVSLQELLIARMLESLWEPIGWFEFCTTYRTRRNRHRRTSWCLYFCTFPTSSATLIEFKPSDKDSNTRNYVY